jgi:hypothetical protein
VGLHRTHCAAVAVPSLLIAILGCHKPGSCPTTAGRPPTRLLLIITLSVYDDGWKELERVTVHENGTYELASREWTNQPWVRRTGTLPTAVLRSVKDQVKAGVFEMHEGVATYDKGLDAFGTVPPLSVRRVVRAVGLTNGWEPVGGPSH